MDLQNWVVGKIAFWGEVSIHIRFGKKPGIVQKEEEKDRLPEFC